MHASRAVHLLSSSAVGPSRAVGQCAVSVGCTSDAAVQLKKCFHFFRRRRFPQESSHLYIWLQQLANYEMRAEFCETRRRKFFSWPAASDVHTGLLLKLCISTTDAETQIDIQVSSPKPRSPQLPSGVRAQETGETSEEGPMCASAEASICTELKACCSQV